MQSFNTGTSTNERKNKHKSKKRNQKLLSLKLNSGKTVQTLNSLKKKLTDAMREQDIISSDMRVKKEKQGKTQVAIKKTKDEIKKT